MGDRPQSADVELDDGVRAELLLHSLAALREIVLGALDVADARRVVEVGGEVGGFTAHLARRAAGHGGHVDVVDPAPSEELEDFARACHEVDLVRSTSPAALHELALGDAYVLDGDHNYVTVTGELAAISARARGRPFPLVILHDVGWPCARRDQYYRPDALPAESVHPYTYDQGVRPDAAGVVDGGFSGAGEFAYAIEEGGPRNGVLTAVDDFRRERPELAFVRVPSIFGLGVLSDRGAPYAADLGRALAWCDENPLLERLERNRVALYLRANDAVRALEAAAAERDAARRALAELRGALGALADSPTVGALDLLMHPLRLARGRRGGLRHVLHDLAGDRRHEGIGDADG